MSLRPGCKSRYLRQNQGCAEFTLDSYNKERGLEEKATMAWSIASQRLSRTRGFRGYTGE